MIENENNLVNEIHNTHQRIAPFIQKTQLLHSPTYSQLTGANVYFKCENLQLTGSFKLRGALNKFLSLTDEQKKNGVVAASTGNHGKAVAYAAKTLGSSCTIFTPNQTCKSKLSSIHDLGAEISTAGNDCVETELAARAFARRQAQIYISPYNDLHVIAGQGTIGVEICEQLDSIDAVFATVGGGGLISGIATYVKHRIPNCEIVGCSPSNSNVMFKSLAAGKILDLPSAETLSDSSAGGIEQESITFEYCKQLTQTFSVSESEIAKSLVQFVELEGMLIEGAAAVPIAALLKHPQEYIGKNVVVVLCGANINAERLFQVASA